MNMHVVAWTYSTESLPTVFRRSWRCRSQTGLLHHHAMAFWASLPHLSACQQQRKENIGLSRTFLYYEVALCPPYFFRALGRGPYPEVPQLEEHSPSLSIGFRVRYRDSSSLSGNKKPNKKPPTTLGFCPKNMLVAASVGRRQASLRASDRLDTSSQSCCVSPAFLKY